METTSHPRRMRALANAITLLRIAGSFVLLACAPLSPTYFAVYVACGASDVLDGWIARRAGVANAFGASLDSAADTVFTLALIGSLLPTADLPLWLWLWIAAIALVKVASLAVGYARFRAYAALHTYANKATGLAVFVLPVLFALLGPLFAATLVCVLATLAAFEELILNLVAATLDPDAKGLLWTRGSDGGSV